MANWEEFLTRAGQGLQGYAALREQQQSDEEQKKYRAAELALRQADVDENRAYHQSTLAATERGRMQDQAQHGVDQLFKAGVIAPDSYRQDAMKAALPETGGQDVAGMAINATRQYGQARTGEFESRVPAAVNEMYSSGKLMEPIPGGGYAFMDAGTRSNLDVAKGNADIARQNRATAREVALIRAGAAGGKSGLSTEQRRIQFMQKGIERRMKPQVDPDTGHLTKPGMSSADAYRDTRQEWERVKGDSAAAAPTADVSSLDVDGIRAQIEGLDDETAQQQLEASGYTPNEVTVILSDR